MLPVMDKSSAMSRALRWDYLQRVYTSFWFFFFQAEDGIRDRDVTGVQTCALPISIESVDRDLERAAYTLGRPEWRTALEVTLPLARNGILAGLVLAFARALGEFGATLMLAGNIPGKTATVPLAIYSAVQTGETGDALLLVGLLTALSCVVLVVAGRLGARAA